MPVHGAVTEALDDVDVLVDYASHAAVGDNVRAAIGRGVAVVIGSTGLSDSDYAEATRSPENSAWASSRLGTFR
ncbi:MAG: hypothetical protein GEU74_10960 [Nitriliruptorales bacterium]|nr:hypothetical protein [Nitriliruptorales bacterium]